jgi:alpha-tubulin suppressor-like RCC1 family protein
MGRKHLRAGLIFSILAFLTAVNCSSLDGLSAAGTGSFKPQGGPWNISLLVRDVVHWEVSFTVSDDGERILQAQALNYAGTLTPNTPVTIVFDTGMPEKIDDNKSFELSFSIYSGFSMNTYVFKGTFASAAQAAGTVRLGDTDYHWTAYPKGMAPTGEEPAGPDTSARPSPESGLNPPQTTEQHPSDTKVPSQFVDAMAVAASENNTCALTSSGRVKCWGDNSGGQLGGGAGADSGIALDVAGLPEGEMKVAAGSIQSCALASDGVVRCWGSGFLGDGEFSESGGLAVVQGLPQNVIDIAIGGYHICALTAMDGMMCWGNNDYGELGIGTKDSQPMPMEVPGLSGAVVAIAAGGGHTCAVTTGGGVKCWGGNWRGQLGDGTETERLSPVNVAGLTEGVKAIAVGHDHSCALTLNGGVKCWGSNGNGQLGDGTFNDSSVPVDVRGLPQDIVAITAGESHTCALGSGGGVKCWGKNGYGELGDGTFDELLHPVDVAGLSSGVTAVAAGGFHSCALTADGRILCWGDNRTGQLGDGTKTNSNVPVFVLE